MSPFECFDPKYKIILDSDIFPNHVEIMLWIDKYTKGKVQFKFLRSFDLGNGNWCVQTEGNLNRGVGKDRVYIAFEDESDAIIFKIKFL